MVAPLRPPSGPSQANASFVGNAPKAGSAVTCEPAAL